MVLVKISEGWLQMLVRAYEYNCDFSFGGFGPAIAPILHRHLNSDRSATWKKDGVPFILELLAGHIDKIGLVECGQKSYLPLAISDITDKAQIAKVGNILKALKPAIKIHTIQKTKQGIGIIWSPASIWMSLTPVIVVPHLTYKGLLKFLYLKIDQAYG